MKPHSKLRRVVSLTVASVLLVGAAAIADTSQVNVSLGVVNGARNLQVTGAGGTGAPALAFGPNSTSSPLGVMVGDLMYERIGYQVTATLSNLYRINKDTGALDCAATVPAGAFTLTPSAMTASGLDGVVEPLLSFQPTDVKDELDAELTAAHLLELADLGVVLPADIFVTVASVPGAVADLRDLVADNVVDGLSFMTSTEGGAATFTGAAAHPTCAGAGATTTAVVQQGATATPTGPSWSAVTQDAFDTADTTPDTQVSAAEAVTAGLLPPGAASQGGVLWEATNQAIRSALAGAGVTQAIIDDVIVAMTNDVVNDLLAVVAGLVLDLIGQTGVYATLPTLDLEPTAIGSAPTGLYHGVMTVTMLDQ